MIEGLGDGRDRELLLNMTTLLLLRSGFGNQAKATHIYITDKCLIFISNKKQCSNT